MAEPNFFHSDICNRNSGNADDPGCASREFGDKTSLIVEATTRSGLESGNANGTISMGYGSFATPTASATFASGSKTLANFLALDGVASHRFLDAPEFHTLHAR